MVAVALVVVVGGQCGNEALVGALGLSFSDSSIESKHTYASGPTKAAVDTTLFGKMRLYIA